MIRAHRVNATAQDDSSPISGWNIAPNVPYSVSLTPGTTSCGVFLFAEDGHIVASGAALVGTEQPCVLIPQSGQTIGMIDAELGWHLLLTTIGTESQRTIRINPAVDLPDEIHPIYGDDDLALVRATAGIDGAAHYIDDLAVNCPLGLGAGLGDIASVPVDGAAVVGQVESVTWTGTPNGAPEQAVIRRHVPIAPETAVAPPTPPVVVDDAGETTADETTSGNVLANDAIGLAVVAVNSLSANVGASVAGSNGGAFVISSSGAWTFDPGSDFDSLTGDQTAATSVTYHASNGAAEASATLTITVSSGAAVPLFEYIDEFSSLNTSMWDTSGVASAVIASGKLVTEGKTSTWGQYATAQVAYLGTIPANFELSTHLEWVHRSACMGQMMICLRTATQTNIIGINDAWDDSGGSPGFTSCVGNDCYSTGKATEPHSGSRTLFVRVNNNEIQFYRDGVLVKSGALSGPVTAIGLVNTRYQSYNGNTAKWDYFRLVEI
jgi:hypothetical protein